MSVEEPDPAYCEFVGCPVGAASVETIPLSVEIDSLPAVSGCTPLFDTGESWALFFSGDDYLLRYGAPHLPEPLAAVTLRRDCSSGTVHCGRGLITQEGERAVLSNPLHYPVDQVLLMCILAEKRGMIMHAAGFDFQETGLVFAGKSGAGKTTLSRILDGRMGFTALSDDRIIMRKTGVGLSIHGTPWPGDARIARNSSARLGAVLFLEQARENRIEGISPSEAMRRLASTASIPWFEPTLLHAQLTFCDDLLARTPAYVFSFTPDRRAADLIEKSFS